MRTLIRRYRVPLAEIGYVRAIVESYDGIATVSSPLAGSGAVEWSIPETMEQAADALAAALAVEVGLVEIPEDATGAPSPERRTV